MSYNISRWKETYSQSKVIPLTTVIDEILGESRIPLRLMPHPKRLAIILDAEEGHITCELVRLGREYSVRAIEAALYGAGSNGEYGAMKMLLPRFFTEYDATVVWESGDTIEKISIVDGNVVEERI